VYGPLRASTARQYHCGPEKGVTVVVVVVGMVEVGDRVAVVVVGRVVG